MPTVSHGSRDENLDRTCVASYGDEPCTRPAVDGTPVPLCNRHLRLTYEFANGLVDATWRDRLREITTEANVSHTPPTRRSWVYILRKDGRVKIGYTTNLARRFAALQPDTVLYVAAGDRNTERDLHGRFGAHWITGEWFADAPEIHAYIAAQHRAA